MMCKTGWRRFAAIACVVTCGIGALPSRAADEKDLAVEKVPKVILDAVKAKFPEATVSKAATEKDDGKEIVEVSFSVGETKYEAEFTPEGKVLAIDKEVAAKDLPEKVTKAIEGKYPGATLGAIEEVTKDDKVAYHEIDLKTKGGEAVEIQVDPDGKIINEEKKGKEGEKKEEK